MAIVLIRGISTTRHPKARSLSFSLSVVVGEQARYVHRREEQRTNPTYCSRSSEGTEVQQPVADYIFGRIYFEEGHTFSSSLSPPPDFFLALPFFGPMMSRLFPCLTKQTLWLRRRYSRCSYDDNGAKPASRAGGSQQPATSASEVAPQYTKRDGVYGYGYRRFYNLDIFETVIFRYLVVVFN